MSLTNEDLDQVRNLMVDAIQTLVMPRFDDIDKRFGTLESGMTEVKEDVRVLKEDMRVVKDSLGRLEGKAEALEADIKELYILVRSAQNPSYADKQFAKLPFEQKVLQMYEDVKLLAQEAGVTLPS